MIKKIDSIINTADIESKQIEINNISSDIISQNALKHKKRIITENPRSILKFYRDNKSLLPFKKEEEFKEWLKANYLVVTYNGKFIATEDSVEKGYMINSKKAIINLETLDVAINYGAQITLKGQNYILDYFEEVQNEN